MPNEKASSSSAPPDIGAHKPDRKPPKAGVKVSVATDLWIELMPYPAYRTGGGRLWLRVDNEWRYLHNPPAPILASVQLVFCGCRNDCEIVVWYDLHNKITGLVVRSAYTSTQS